MNTKTTGKDFFLHLGLLVSLYAGVGFLLNLLFSVINAAYPQITSYYYTPSISFPVAALLILTPVFLILASIIGKIELSDPEKKDIWVTKWGNYLTLFVTGAAIVGDLIAVVYYYLDGQDITTAFLLKVLAVFVVLAAVFGYTWSTMTRSLSSRTRMIWRIGAVSLVTVSIILGFMIIGSPRTQRLVRYDTQKINDLQSIQREIISYWQMKNSLPPAMSDLSDPLSYFVVPTDPETGAAYSYAQVSPTTFKLCATFNSDSKTANGNSTASQRYYPVEVNQNWDHDAGEQCFERTIDPERYPSFDKNF